MTRRLVFTALAASTLLLAACSSGSSTDETAAASPEASASMVGGMATCDEATFTQVVTDQLATEGDARLFSLDGFECVDGWAAVFPTIGTTEEDAVTETLVFEAEGQFWIPKDRGEVCGTPSESDPSAYPADSQVPEALWQPACNTN